MRGALAVVLSDAIFDKDAIAQHDLDKMTVKNLMIVGDGMGATIVTGNLNAQDGSTTFRSATFGKFVVI